MNELLVNLRGLLARVDPPIRQILKWLAILLLCVVLGTLNFYFSEQRAIEGLSMWDSLWFTMTTITTIGYGDYSPSTFAGRTGTVVLLYIVGWASLPILASLLISLGTDRRELRMTGQTQNKSPGSILIVNFPDEKTVARLVTEIREAPSLRGAPICLVDEDLERLPTSEAFQNVQFVRGSTIREETFQNAGAEECSGVFVLPVSVTSGADATTSVTVQVLRKLTSARIVPFVVDDENARLFEDVRALIHHDLMTKAAVQEFTDPHVARCVDQLLMYSKGSVPFTFEVAELAGKRIREVELAMLALNHDADQPYHFRLLAHVHDSVPDWVPDPDGELQKGDTLLLAGTSSERPEDNDWTAFERTLIAAIGSA